MKKVILTPVILLIILISCNKDVVNDVEEDFFNQLSLETKAVLNQTDLVAMKQGYSMLSDNEQEALWNSKLSYIIENDDLNSSQKNILISMHDLLEKHGISKMKSDNSIADKFWVSNKVALYRHFSSEQLYFIIEHPFIKKDFSLKYANKYFSDITFNSEKLTSTGQNVTESSCECLYDIGCGFGNICNKNTPCSGGTDCGFWGTSRCKGACEQANGGPVL